MFDLFVQLDGSADRSRGGLGIGLTLAHRLVLQHGGRVEARSEGEGRGSEFRVTLPLATEAGDLRSPSRPSVAAPRRPLHVLLIEDNPDARESLKFDLELEGHTVEVAADGPDGLERAAVTTPDVAIVDLGLPGLDGYGVARALRGKYGAGIRIVALTGYGQPEDRRRTREAGFDAHVTKPASAEDVLAALPD